VGWNGAADSFSDRCRGAGRRHRGLRQFGRAEQHLVVWRWHGSECSTGSIQKDLYQKGVLTAATDSPVYPPAPGGL
jgi:hypothetical protein